MSRIDYFLTEKGMWNVARMLKCLESGGKTRVELSELLFMSRNACYRCIRHLQHSEPKRIYLQNYSHPGKRGNLAPVYAIGNKPDAKHPGRPSRAERRKREMASLKADPERLDLYKSKRSVKNKVYRMKQKGEKPTWMSALF